MTITETLEEADLYARVMDDSNCPDVASVIRDLASLLREATGTVRALERLVLNDLRGEGPAMSVSHDGSVLTIATIRTDGSFAYDETHLSFDGSDADLLRIALKRGVTQ